MSPPAPSTLSALSSGDDHIRLPATAPGTDEPLAPIENRRVRAVSSNHLGGVRLDLVAARFATSVRGCAADPWTWASPVKGLAL